MHTKFGLTGVALLLAATAAQAQQAAPSSSLKVNLPPDSPLALIQADWGDSRTSERGSAIVVDLRTSLTLRNSSQRRIRGVTWMVLSQEVTPGGRASVTRPLLNIGPGEVFPVRIKRILNGDELLRVKAEHDDLSAICAALRTSGRGVSLTVLKSNVEAAVGTERPITIIKICVD